MEHETIDAPVTIHGALDATTDEVVAAPAAALVADELLVEEISIDGMCGVY